MQEKPRRKGVGGGAPALEEVGDRFQERSDGDLDILSASAPNVPARPPTLKFSTFESRILHI